LAGNSFEVLDRPLQAYPDRSDLIGDALDRLGDVIDQSLAAVEQCDQIDEESGECQKRDRRGDIQERGHEGSIHWFNIYVGIRSDQIGYLDARSSSLKASVPALAASAIRAVLCTTVPTTPEVVLLALALASLTIRSASERIVEAFSRASSIRLSARERPS